MDTRRAVVVTAVLIVGCAVAADPQPKFPRAELTSAIATSPIRAGAPVRLSLKVKLPADVHVQSDKPRDPSLIPTVLTVNPPAGVAVERIVYPKATDLVQVGRREPLAVFGGEFTIDVRLSLTAGVSAGEIVVPGQFKYQACDATLCYPPTKADVRWRLKVEEADGGLGPLPGSAGLQCLAPAFAAGDWPG